MGSIRRSPRNASRWEARYRDPAGRQRTRTFHRRADAQVFLKSVEADVLRGAYRDPQLDKVIFKTFANGWAEGLTRKAKTRQGYQALLANHLIPAFGPWPLVAIDQPAVQQFVSDLSAHGYAARTVRNAYAVLRRVMKLAVVGGIIPSSPCIEVELPSEPTTEMTYLSAEQVNALADAITPHFQLLILFAAYTGLRSGEIAALRWRRVDLRTGKVEVAESAADVGGRFVYGTTKTGKVRTVPLTRFLCEALGETLAHGVVPHPNSFVFTSITGRPLRHNLFLKRHFKPAVVRAGLPAALRFHDLRHTYAGLLVAQNAHPKAIQERMGHSSIQVTFDVYGHLLPGVSEQLTEGLDAAYQRARVVQPWCSDDRNVVLLRPDATGNPSDQGVDSVPPAGLEPATCRVSLYRV